MLKVKGLNKTIKTLEGMMKLPFGNYALVMAIQVRQRMFKRMAEVSGKMVRETHAEQTGKTTARVLVRVPYAAYNNQGERGDGTHEIQNRTAPGERYFAQKAVKELQFDSLVEVINDDLESKVLK